MPTKRRRTIRSTKGRITAEAVEAFEAGDFHALHSALGLGPWEPSPLPESIEPLGVDPDNPPRADGTCWAEAWPKVVELQRELQAAAGKTRH